jgi:hypothetical protein
VSSFSDYVLQQQQHGLGSPYGHLRETGSAFPPASTAHDPASRWGVSPADQTARSITRGAALDLLTRMGMDRHRANEAISRLISADYAEGVDAISLVDVLKIPSQFMSAADAYTYASQGDYAKAAAQSLGVLSPGGDRLSRFYGQASTKLSGELTDGLPDTISEPQGFSSWEEFQAAMNRMGLR